MNSSIAVLEILVRGDMSPRDLARYVRVKDRQMSNILARLERDGYVVRRRGIAAMSDTAKAVLLRDIAGTMDIRRILGRSNEAVLAKAGETEGATVEEIARSTGLSISTVAKSAADLLSVGALIKRGGLLAVNPSRRPIGEFAALLRLEGDKRYVDGAEIIYNRDPLVIRKVPAGQTARGEPTGFTAFGEHGIDYRTTHDYFCECGYELDEADILLHALLEASRLRSGADVIMCMIFYLQNKDRIKITSVRTKAASMGLRDLWLDIEAYIRKDKPKDAKMFFPWTEFKEKLDLYDVPEQAYLLPIGYDPVFCDLNDALDAPITAYLFGGENMRIKGLKNSTKDCDIIVETEPEFEAIKNALVRMGYIPHTTTPSEEDERIHPTSLLTHVSKSRIDLFTRTIMNMPMLPRMMEKSDMRDYGRLRLGLMCNEHVFVLKAAAGREGDIHDMFKLVQARRNSAHPDGQFDWDEVLRVVSEQSSAAPTPDTIVDIFASVSHMHSYKGMNVPILPSLRRLVADLLIESALRGGPVTIINVVRHAERFDIAETAIRNRIDAMVRSGKLDKTGVRRAARVTAKADAYTRGDPITGRRLRRYLSWRFVLREQPLPGDDDALSKDLQESGFETIRQVDEMVGGLVGRLNQYETEQFHERYFNAVGAVRVCIGLDNPRLGNDRQSTCFVVELHKYRKQAESGCEGSD